MPKIDYDHYDKDDISKILVGDTVYWKDPFGAESGNYEVTWMSDPPARQNAGTKVSLFNDRFGEKTTTIGSLRKH